MIQLLDQHPRVPLGVFATPLEHAPRVSRALRRPVFIKRDDLIGPALGGNKARKLEYLMAAAQASGQRRIVTFGGLQSNHARMTAAAARMYGFEPHLLLFGARPRRLTGNLLLNEQFGARMYFLPFPQGSTPTRTLEQSIRLVRVLARILVGRHYFMPVGGHGIPGCFGYVQAAQELDAQARAAGLGAATVVVAAGTGGTLAGMLAGLRLCHSQLDVLGIDIGRLWRGFRASIAHMAGTLCAHLGERQRFAPGDVPLIEQTYAGCRYAEPSLEGMAAQRRLAWMEGIVLDPVYTAKAFAGLLDLAECGVLERGKPLIFLHTGGAPGVFL